MIKRTIKTSVLPEVKFIRNVKTIAEVVSGKPFFTKRALMSVANMFAFNFFGAPQQTLQSTYLPRYLGVGSGTIDVGTGIEIEELGQEEIIGTRFNVSAKELWYNSATNSSIVTLFAYVPYSIVGSRQLREFGLFSSPTVNTKDLLVYASAERPITIDPGDVLQVEFTLQFRNSNS